MEAREKTGTRELLLTSRSKEQVMQGQKQNASTFLTSRIQDVSVVSPANC